MMLCTGEFQTVGAIPRERPHRMYLPQRRYEPRVASISDDTAMGRPPAPIGVGTLWAMYLVVFGGSAVQWLCS